MKKVTIFCACIVMLASFSFFKTVQPPLYKKIGKALYATPSTASLKPADLTKLKAALTKQYGIKDFTGSIAVHYVTGTSVTGHKAFGIAEAKVSSSVFQQNMLADGDEEVKQACMFVVCSGGGSSLDEAAQVLSANSVH